ncbi:hypothetical protein RJ639_021658 [Escallonia herrerae]|uniref:Integrase catalytic domain-containing protein n=1 Tax=Escallonia herrerae TaxID=1293975 RepID=A0AA88V491_9ASTE|nr:hypothetical protein RJ639_021658 [Escallonia herrerae]
MSSSRRLSRDQRSTPSRRHAGSAEDAYVNVTSANPESEIRPRRKRSPSSTLKNGDLRHRLNRQLFKTPHDDLTKEIHELKDVVNTLQQKLDMAVAPPSIHHSHLDPSDLRLRLTSRSSYSRKYRSTADPTYNPKEKSGDHLTRSGSCYRRDPSAEDSTNSSPELVARAETPRRSTHRKRAPESRSREWDSWKVVPRYRSPERSPPRAESGYPLSEAIQKAKLPPNFRMPQCDPYDGTGDPGEHVYQFETNMLLLQKHFISSRSRRKNSTSLLDIVQEKNESLACFLGRFSAATLEIDNLDESVKYTAFLRGLRPTSKFAFSVNKSPPEYLETHRERHGEEKKKRPQEVTPQEGKSAKRSKHDERRLKEPFAWENLTPLNAKPSQILHEIKDNKALQWLDKLKSRPNKRNKDLWCHFHNDHGHTTDNCGSLKRAIKALIKRCQLRKFVAPREGRQQTPPAIEEREDREENAGTINTISGGLAAGDSKDIKTPHDDPLVITIKAGNFDVKHVLIDNGSSAEVLFYDAFNKMNISTDRLRKMDTPLYGFSNHPVAAEGIIALSVAIGTPPAQANFMLDFVAVKVPSAYNAILGQPTLNQLQAVASTYQLKMKFPTEHEIGEAKGDQTTARQCYVTSCRSRNKEALIIEDLREDTKIQRGEPVEDLVNIEVYPGEENKTVRIGSNLKEDTKLELKSFEELKTHLSSPPLLSKPLPGEDLLIYLSVTEVTVSTVLIREEDGVQKPIYYVSKVLQDVETRYPKIDKIALALIISARRLRPYFQSHTIVVLTDQPLRKVLLSPEASGRLVNWSVELGEFDLQYKPRTAIKAQALAQALADFIVECTLPEDPPQSVISEVTDPWNLYVDGSSAVGNSGAEIILISPEGTLYKKSFSLPYLRCLRPSESLYALQEVHEGICGQHLGGRTLAQKILRQGYYWPTMQKDAIEFTRRCDKCQKFAPLSHTPVAPLTSIVSPIPFAVWGMDLLGPFPIASGQRRFVIVAIDYFTKWTEAESLATITSARCEDFFWKNVVCRFEVPRALVVDNEKQFDNNNFQTFCSNLSIDLRFTSMAHPQSNG